MYSPLFQQATPYFTKSYARIINKWLNGDDMTKTINTHSMNK